MARILLIEDNPANQKLAFLILTGAGHEVICADNAAAGIRQALAHQPQIILMDIQLPDIDGFEAMRRLKCDARTSAIPIVAVTAYAMRGDGSRMREAGCDAYVSKPYRRAQLLEAIEALIVHPTEI